MNKQAAKCIGLLLLATTFPMGFTGCSSLSTGASMQIDVEVYKGPLSKEPAIQWGELKGVMDEAAVSFESTEKIAQAYMLNTFQADSQGQSRKSKDSGASSQYKHGDNDDGMMAAASRERMAGMIIAQYNPGRLYAATRNSMDEVAYKSLIKHEDTIKSCESLLKGEKFNRYNKSKKLEKIKLCAIYQRIFISARLARLHANALSIQSRDCDSKLRQSPIPSGKIELIRACYKTALADIAEFAFRLQTNAFILAESHVGFALDSRLDRGLMVAFSNLAAEYGNQIGSRADVLLKQMQGDHRRILPPSIHLRDTQPTAFLNLFIWDHAGAPSLCEEGCSSMEEITRTRVRSVEKLFADHNWSKINTLHASGQGEMRMAFIKDDIGNWTLKSFENDPEELLNAYKQTGLAAIRSATQLLSKGPGNLSSAQKLLNFGNQVALGTGPADVASAQSQTVEALHRRTGSRLLALAKKLGRETNNKSAQIVEKKAEAEQKTITLKGKKGLLDEGKQKRGQGDPVGLRLEAGIKQSRAHELNREASGIEQQIVGLRKLSITAGSDDATRMAELIQQLEADKVVRVSQADSLSMEAEGKIAAAAALEEADGKIAAMEQEVTEAQQDLDKSQTELAELEAQKSALPTVARKEAKAILDSHDEFIDELEAGVVADMPGASSRNSFPANTPGGGAAQ